MEIIIVPTAVATELELSVMYDFITSGGQIKLKPEVLEKQIRACLYFAFADVGIPGACAAIKTPQPKYLAKVFDRSGEATIAPEFQYELGYCVTRPDCYGRGYATKLVKALMDKVPNLNLFATTHTDAMRHIFAKLGWERSVNPYINEDGQSIDLFLLKR